jgi:hypothetical protein
LKIIIVILGDGKVNLDIKKGLGMYHHNGTWWFDSNIFSLRCKSPTCESSKCESATRISRPTPREWYLIQQLTNFVYL